MTLDARASGCTSEAGISHSPKRMESLELFGELKTIPGVNRIRDLGFDVPRGKLTPKQSVILNKTKEEIPSTSDTTKADDTELQEITENAIKSTDDLITQFKGEEKLPMHELLGLDKQLKSIRGSLKVEVAKIVQLEEQIKKEGASLRKYEKIQNMMMECEKISGGESLSTMTN